MCWRKSRKAQSPTDIPSVFWVLSFYPQILHPLSTYKDLQLLQHPPAISSLSAWTSFYCSYTQNCPHLGTSHSCFVHIFEWFPHLLHLGLYSNLTFAEWPLQVTLFANTPPPSYSFTCFIFTGANNSLDICFMSVFPIQWKLYKCRHQTVPDTEWVFNKYSLKA